MITPLAARRGMITPLARGIQRVAGGGWWDLSGTLTSCVAAYQPKGAASYAASKVNLVNSETYSVVDGDAYPAWSAAGWQFTAASSQYLLTGIPTNTIISTIVNFDNSSTVGTFVCGNYENPYYRLRIYYNSATNIRGYNGSGVGSVYTSGAQAAGTVALHETKILFNGEEQADAAYAVIAKTTLQIAIGGSYATDNSAVNTSFLTARIRAISFYNAGLSTAQVAAISTAMAAL